MLREPFRLTFAQIARLTDRQIWDFYLLPELERQEKESRRRKPDKTWKLDDEGFSKDTRAFDDSTPDSPIHDDMTGAECTDEKGNLISPDTVLDQLVQAGLVKPENAAEVKRQRQEWLSKQRGK